MVKQDDPAFSDRVELADQKDDDARKRDRQEPKEILVGIGLILDLAADFPACAGRKVDAVDCGLNCS